MRRSITFTIGDARVTIWGENRDTVASLLYLKEPLSFSITDMPLPSFYGNHFISYAVNVLIFVFRELDGTSLLNDDYEGFDLLVEPVIDIPNRGKKLFLGFANEKAYLQDEHGLVRIPLEGKDKDEIVLTKHSAIERVLMSFMLDYTPKAEGVPVSTAITINEIYDGYVTLTQDPFSFPEDLKQAVESGHLMEPSGGPVPRWVTDDFTKAGEFEVLKAGPFSWDPFLW